MYLFAYSKFSKTLQLKIEVLKNISQTKIQIWYINQWLRFFNFSKLLSYCVVSITIKVVEYVIVSISFHQIQMPHWRHTMADGAKFWITCKRLKLLRKAGRLQLIQNSAPSTIVWRQCDIQIPHIHIISRYLKWCHQNRGLNSI